MLFEQKIREARLKVGLSQTKAGNAINRTRNAIKGYETGISSPNPDQLVTLCKLYKTTPNDLLEFQQQNEEAKMKHTKLPWEVETHNHTNGEVWHTILRGAVDITHNTQPYEITCDKYSALSQEENEANAAFIVKAVNNHESLKYALWVAHEYMKLHVPEYTKGLNVFDGSKKALTQTEDQL